MGRAEPAPVLLVIEDEKDIRALRAHLARIRRLACFRSGHGRKRAWSRPGTRKPDVVILDLGLPDRDGLLFIHEVRKWSELPILILSARTEEPNKIAALDAGADDYLTKPFGVGELLARVRALLRRRVKAAGVDAQVVTFGDNRSRSRQSRGRARRQAGASDADRISSTQRAAHPSRTKC